MSSVSKSSSKNLHTDGVYQARKTAEQLRGDLQRLGSLDKSAEKELAKWRNVSRGGCAAMVIGGGALIFIILTENFFGFLPIALFVVGLTVGIALKVGAAINSKAVAKHEFPDYRYLSGLGLVSLLEADTAADAQMNLLLNLKEKAKPGTTQGRQEKATWRKMISREPFLTLGGRFQDGTKFDFILTEEITCSGEYFPYRAISGKTKIKLRARKRVRWTGSLRLRFKEKRYSLDSSQQAAIESGIQLPEGARAKKVVVKDGELKLSAVTQTQKNKHKAKMTKDIEGAWKAMPIDEENASNLLSHFSAMMFLSLYQGLNASRSSKQP